MDKRTIYRWLEIGFGKETKRYKPQKQKRIFRFVFLKIKETSVSTTLVSSQGQRVLFLQYINLFVQNSTTILLSCYILQQEIFFTILRRQIFDVLKHASTDFSLFIPFSITLRVYKTRQRCHTFNGRYNLCKQISLKLFDTLLPYWVQSQRRIF